MKTAKPGNLKNATEHSQPTTLGFQTDSPNHMDTIQEKKTQNLYSTLRITLQLFSGTVPNAYIGICRFES